MKRCFISINLPEEAINYIKEIQEQIKKQNLFLGKFTEPENLHLTLKFLRETTDEKIQKIKEKLKQIKFKKFQAETSELGVFSEKFLRIIWIKLENCENLQKQIDKSLKELFEPESRFMSHITIARVKFTKNKKQLIEF